MILRIVRTSLRRLRISGAPFVEWLDLLKLREIEDVHEQGTDVIRGEHVRLFMRNPGQFFSTDGIGDGTADRPDADGQHAVSPPDVDGTVIGSSARPLSRGEVTRLRQTHDNRSDHRTIHRTRLYRMRDAAAGQEVTTVVQSN